MPTYEILIDGKPQKIEVARNSGQKFTAKINDKAVSVELQTNIADMQDRFSIKADDKTYRVHLPKTDLTKPFQMEVEEATFKVEAKTEIHKTALTTSDPALVTSMRKVASKTQSAEGAVTAPMTGKIVSVKVKKDDQVKAGQVLCIIEAMKMENEISAPKTGLIREVNVSEGSPVNEGDILFVIG